jgi:hypothetical protein
MREALRAGARHVSLLMTLGNGARFSMHYNEFLAHSHTRRP